MSLMGLTVKDRIHGFRGVVTGEVKYITGCDQVLVAPPMNEKGEVPEGRWIDVQRVLVDTSLDRIVLNNEETTGPDIAPPVK